MQVSPKIAIQTALINSPLNDHFNKEVGITDRKAYEFYKKTRRNVAKEIDQYNYYVKAVHGLFLVLQRMMVESEGGIYIEGLGYFCCLLVKSRKKKKRKSLLIPIINTPRYIPYFFPDEEFEGWTISGTSDFKAKIKVKATKIKYKLNFDLCASMREAEKAARKIYQELHK